MFNTTMIGNLTRDPEVKSVNGANVTSITLAINGRRKEDPAMFVNVSFWGKPGEAIKQYTTKGQKLAVYGTVSRMSAYVGKDGNAHPTLDVVGNGFDFVSSGNKENQNAAPAQKTNYDAPAPAPQPVETPNDLPF